MYEAEKLLVVNEAYRNADAVNLQLSDAAPILKRLMSGPATRLRTELHGPATELERCKAALPDDVQCFAARDGFSFFSKQTGGLMTAQTMCSFKPTYRVTDWDLATSVVGTIQERTALEPGCIYCGWSATGDLLSLRSAHSNADALLEHLGNVASQLTELATGPACVERLELHGPSMQLERCKANIRQLEFARDARLFVTRGGFQKFEAWSSYVAQPNPQFG